MRPLFVLKMINLLFLIVTKTELDHKIGFKTTQEQLFWFPAHHQMATSRTLIHISRNKRISLNDSLWVQTLTTSTKFQNTKGVLQPSGFWPCFRETKHTKTRKIPGSPIPAFKKSLSQYRSSYNIWVFSNTNVETSFGSLGRTSIFVKQISLVMSFDA